ncbi:MAG: adenylate kinase [bacterium]|nr:adenylate kinase [bacterium]
MQLIMLGAPGTGKGTQGKLLSERYHIPNISTGDILRTAIEKRTDLGNKARTVMEKGELVPDDVMIGLIQQRLTEADCQNGFILDGFPRTVTQAAALDAYLENLKKPINAVIALEVPENEIIARLTSRRVCRNCGKDYNVITNPPPSDNNCEVCQGDIVQRADDTEETVKRRLKVYDEKTMPLQRYFKKQGKLTTFEATGTIAEIQRRIRYFLDNEVK